MRCKSGALPVIFLCLFLSLVVSPEPAHAASFFGTQAQTLKLIDAALAEGMTTGHYGLTLKAAQFMDQGRQVKGAAAQTALNKIAWFSAVNAHRMLDSLLPAIQNQDTRKEMVSALKSLDTGITLIGRRFGWNEATTQKMYSTTRVLIEARIEDLNKSAFKH